MIRWPWKHQPEPDPDAVRAVEVAELRHAAAKGRRDIAAPVIARLNEAYRRNHFSEGWVAALHSRSDGAR